jgi:hypothetical protein
MTELRRTRQRTEVLRTAREGDVAKAVVLAQDHLFEFPDDLDVRVEVASAAARTDDPRLWAEGRELLDGRGASPRETRRGS